ncbi:MAG: GNAT family N-acetyltransferase [Clostridiales bacterium]|jgi:predicted GNAT family acetyltransferase|nr:GNAT family N-acetyltransferase [Clostridiales bacterium]
MIVKPYEDAGAYLADYEDVLLNRETVSQLVLYDAYKSKENPRDIKGLFGVVADGDLTLLHFSYVPDGCLSVYVQDNSKDIRVASMHLADYMVANRILPNGLYAKYEVCEAFIEQFIKKVSCTFAEGMVFDIMEIRQANDIKPAEGVSRLALPNEVKLLTEWMIQFQIEALAKEVNYESALLRVSNLINHNRLFVFENAQQAVVSMASAARRLANGIAINYVYTPEEYRGMGYGAANIYYISKRYLDEGCRFCTLFVDKKNMLSKRAYEKVGYVIVDDLHEYKLLQV